VDFWMLTEKGKRFVVATERKHVENEARILEFLNRVGSATMEVIVQGTGLDELTVRTTLKRLNEKSWVWKKATRLAKF
jgi:DNA-binding MarR family transcriptional regulator